MSTRIVSVFRALGTEIRSNFPIGSAEFDREIDALMDSYIRIANSERTIMAVEPFGEVKFNIEDMLNNAENVVGLIPIQVVWFKLPNPDVNLPENQGAVTVNTKVLHSIPAFLGRIEVEEQRIELALV